MSGTTSIFRRVAVSGMAITDCRMQDVETIIAEAIENRRAKKTEPLHLATVNLSFLRLAAEREDLRNVLAQCDHLFADGWPVLTLAKRAGVPLPERVTGSDLTPLICRWAAERGWRIAFVGGGDRLDGRLVPEVQARYGCPVAGHWRPHYRTSKHDELEDLVLAKEIRSTRPDVVLVAMGCPKQEFWIERNLGITGAGVGIGVGASLDFLAGTVTRAPRIMQLLKLEFLFRAMQEPRRLPDRYRRDLRFFLALLRRQRKRSVVDE